LCVICLGLGLFLFVDSTVLLMLGEKGIEGLLWLSICIMLISSIGFIYPSKYKTAYLMGTSATITAAIVIIIIYLSFVPQMKELTENYDDVDETSSISGFHPEDADFVLIENVYIGTISLLIIASIILIYRYYRAIKLEKGPILEAKYL
jgi:hypothetical protein